MLKTALVALCLVAASAAEASGGSGFTGDYAPEHWTVHENGGTVAFDASGRSLTLVSNDQGYSRSPITTDVTIWATRDATVSFVWRYATADRGGAATDSFGYLSGAAFFGLATTSFQYSGDGRVSFEVTQGQPFGFRMSSSDGFFGAATGTVTQFQVTPISAPVPEPETYALLLAGLGVIVFISRRRRDD